jgi:hypothetical protein
VVYFLVKPKYFEDNVSAHLCKASRLATLSSWLDAWISNILVLQHKGSTPLIKKELRQTQSRMR